MLQVGGRIRCFRRAHYRHPACFQEEALGGRNHDAGTPAGRRWGLPRPPNPSSCGIPHRFKLGRMNRSFPDRGALSIVRRRRLRAVNKEEDRSGHERSGRGPDRRRGKSRLGLAHCINQCRRRWKQPPPALLGSGSRSSACDDHTTLIVSIGGISSISARPSTRFARRSRRDP